MLTCLGRTLLHYAAVMNKLELSEKLLKLGANIEAEDKRGGRPLHVTSSARLACFLIESGAQLNAQDAHGLAPLHLAVVQGNVDMIALLLSYPDVNCQLTTSTGMNVLHLACERTPCEGNTALTVLKQLIHNISCFKELDITVSVADAEESNKSVKSAINFAIRPNNDLVSVELLKVLFANGIHSAECDMLLALRCAMRHELISTCTFLLHVFRPQINHEGIKSLLFFAISLAKWPIFQFLLSQLSDKAQDRGSSRDVLMDIEAVQNPFSCIHQVSSQSPPVSFTLLVYPIEWCIVTAAFEHSLEKNRKQKDTEKGIRELQKIFSVIMTHCREHGHKSRSSMHKFDFLTNRSIMSSVLSSASDNQVVLHMLTQWLAFNHMQPSTMIANMRPVRSRGMVGVSSPPFLALPRSVLFILCLYKSCYSCFSYWMGDHLGVSIWQTLLDSFYPGEPKLSSALEVVLLLALGLGPLENVKVVIETDDASILPASHFGVTRLSDLCAVVVRNRYFSADQILRLQFEQIADQVPRFLLSSVAGAFLRLPAATKCSLTLCADFLQQLSPCCGCFPEN